MSNWNGRTEFKFTIERFVNPDGTHRIESNNDDEVPVEITLTIRGSAYYCYATYNDPAEYECDFDAFDSNGKYWDNDQLSETEIEEISNRVWNNCKDGE